MYETIRNEKKKITWKKNLAKRTADDPTLFYKVLPNIW